jgi:hypothetical protein
MFPQSFAQICSPPDIKSLRNGLALQDVNVRKCVQLVWPAESKLATVALKGQERPPSLKLRRDSLRSPHVRRAWTGGKGIRTPDFQLAKLALYQLSYAPFSKD